MKSICIGIDFGTTNTLVSYLESKSKYPRLCRLGRGNDLIPTTIHVNSNGALLFGDDADDYCESDPAGYARAFKLRLGGSKTLKRIDSGKEYSAVDLTREFLKHIREKCGDESFQGNYRIGGAVITIPICFSPAQQDDLQRAAMDAGFQRVTLIPEPEAAGRAFCSLSPDDAFRGSALIVDWGGGTIDLSLVQRTDDGFKVQRKFSRGDETIGGEVLDELMWDHVAKRLKDEFKVDLNKEPEGKRRLLRKRLRQAKENLSSVNKYPLVLALRGGSKHIELIRKEWEEVIDRPLEQVVGMVEEILAQLKADKQKAPDIILLVGGSSKTPRLRELLRTKTSIPCKTWDKSMEAVALGAAFYAHDLNEILRPYSSVEKRPSEKPQESPITYRIQISSIEAKLGTTKTLKLGKETISVNIPANIRNGQAIKISSLVKYGTKYSAIISIQENPFLKHAAEQGDKKSQYLWGMSNYYGIGTEQNTTKAVNFIELAATQGEVRAQFMMGRVLSEGLGNRGINLKQALSYFEKAYKGGMVEALQWVNDCKRILASSKEEYSIVVTPYVHWSYLTDHYPFPLYVQGYKYNVLLSDVPEQVFPKLYRNSVDVIVRIQKTYDKKLCPPYFK